MKYIFWTSLFLSVILVAGCQVQSPDVDGSSETPAALPEWVTVEQAGPSPSESVLSPADHIIGVRQVDGVGEFYNTLTGKVFTPRGVNYVFVPHNGVFESRLLKVGVYDGERTRQDFQTLAENGYNTVRVFIDHCSRGSGCIGIQNGNGLNPDYLDNMADMIAAARESGLFILFTSNDLPDEGGYSQQVNGVSNEHFPGYRNSFYLTPEAIDATRRYWRDIITGLIARGAATEVVLGWQLLNEQWMFLDQPPLSLESGMVETTTGTYDMGDDEAKWRMVSDGLIHYIAEMKAEILLHDPTALVTMGFFPPGAAPGWYVETSSLLAEADLDFFDFHVYSGNESIREAVEAFGMQGYESKPIILGEYGAFRHIYSTIESAARAITEWQSESCDHGFDGWLYWAYYPAEAHINDRTWGLVDESGFLLDMLAPITHPDPCELVIIPSSNLAFGKTVRASASLAAEPPSNAVDENQESQWGAGQDAPQWIEIDLGAPHTIREIRLLVAQWPEGETVHRILARSIDGDFVELVRYSRSTAEGDWLIFTPETPIPDIQFIRIETLISPSWVAWKEIEVYGDLMP